MAQYQSQAMPLTLYLISIFALLINGCGTIRAPRAYIGEDHYARYYVTTSGKLLRVAQDGTVFDITCVKDWRKIGPAFETINLDSDVNCERGKIEVVGTVDKVGDDWDMKNFDISPETGSCEPLMPSLASAGKERAARSCWHRIWEIPTTTIMMIVAVPVGFAYMSVLGFLHAVGLYEGDPPHGLTMSRIDMVWKGQICERRGVIIA